MRKTQIVGVLLITALLVLGACAPTPAPAPAPAPEETPAPAPEPTQGQIAYKVTLLSAKWSKWAGKDSLLLTYAITNTGSEKLNFLYWHIRATDQEGNIGTNGETTFDLPEEIYPGETYQGTASWHFPPKVTEVKVQFVYEHTWTERTAQATLTVRR